MSYKINNRNLIGVMQGRLLPKYNGRYQAHPVNYWEEEFHIAKDIGLDCIEFILDYSEVDINPLLTSKGIKKINSLIDKTNIQVKTICADYFMLHPLHSNDQKEVDFSKKILTRLLQNSSLLNVSEIVIPCVDQASLKELNDLTHFVSQINEFIPMLEKLNINLSLETDLPPYAFLSLLNKFSSERVKVNYDIGNSASSGYSCTEEISLYGDRISDIHIKDRILEGGPTILGKGNANFKEFFSALSKISYNGPFIMQAYRDEEGLSVFKKQLNWIMPYLKKLETDNE